MVFHGGGDWGGGGGGGGGMWRLHSALDAKDEDDILGKVYDSRVIRRLPKYLAWVKSYLARAVAGTLTRTVANLAMPYLVFIATDKFIKTGNLGGLSIAALAYLGAALLMWGGQYLETLYLSYAGQRILFRLRTEMFDHLHQLSLSFFDHNKVGKIMSRVQNDVDQLQTLLTQDIVMLAADVLTLIAIAVIMLTVNARLALLTLTVVPVLAIVMVVWQQYARRVFIRVRQAIAVVNDNLQETISGVRVVQSLSREEVNLGQFNTVNKANLDANVEAVKLQAVMMPTVQILTDGAFVLVLIFGGFQVLAGQTTPGVLLAFLLYIQRFFAPVQELTMLYTDLQMAMASGARIFELIDVKPEIKDSPQAVEMPPLKGEVKFQHVGFAYDPGTEILHDIDLTVNPGETVAIAGRTGAGKSSLTSLIARFYEVTKGEVLIDGYNVNSVTQQSLRHQIGIVPQDPFLFSGSIEDNIKYGHLEASHEEVIEAAKAAGVHDSITQLVCLARAILANPAILILDEATSSVDTNTERIMQASLQRLSHGRTCIIIAHRLSTVTNADRIIVLEHGKIAETGSHRELMAKQGLYHHMFETLSAPTLEQYHPA
ncbi:MAG: ABC transporter ATP-binding protein [Chloroflexi bacterium]|nr:ABC transporter ATP-binding protein [Chloroflexota bacterium]